MFGVKDALAPPTFAEVGPIPHHINQGALGHAKRACCVVHAHRGHKPSWGHHSLPFVAGVNTSPGTCSLFGVSLT